MSSIAKQALSILRNKFGHDCFRGNQQDVIEKTVQGYDSFVLMATGTGKSLCYQIPAVLSSKLTVVVSPLISLMTDQVLSLQKRGIDACFLGAPNVERPAELSTYTKNTKILYLTPEKLMRDEAYLERLDRERGIGLIAIDEAHCISEWGHDFRHEYRHLSVIRERLPNVPIMALTATATPRAQKDIITNLKLREDYVFVKGGFNRPNLTYTMRKKSSMVKDLESLFTNENLSPGISIIYTTSRKETEKIVDTLRKMNIDASYYHAGMFPEDRHAILEDFHSGKITTLVATSAFGMGIDKPDIRRVIHYGPPTSIEAYQQQTGRAGRDGKPSECICLWNHSDLYRIETLSGLHDSHNNAAEVITPETYDMKRNLVGGMYKMITIHECRRKQLLRYFGESTSNVECGKCDVCQSSGRELYDAGQQAYIVLKTIEETGNRYGKGFVRAILIGKPGEFQERISRVYGERLERAPEVYGKGANVPMTWWNPFIEYLLNNQMLIKEGREYPILCLARKGKEFLSAYENVPGACDAVRDNEPSPPGTPTFCYPEEPVIKGKKPVRRPVKKPARTKGNSALDRVRMILSENSGEKIPLLAKNNRLKATPAVYFDGDHLVTRTMEENSR